MTPQLAAFLAVIRRSEGTDKYPNPWAVCFEGKFTITDFTDHPAIMGTWHGESLDFLGPEYVGKVSTAAGAYQLIKPTWALCKAALQLPDFSANSQDSAALYLIRNAGAEALIGRGDVSGAIYACRHIWASLPGSNVGQPMAKLSELLEFYGEQPGMVA